jgi:hypothetical protein
MNEKELLQELVQSVKNIQADMQNTQANMQAEMQNMRADISEIKDRTLKIEITLENETNKNIQLLMEAQSLNAEKMKDINFALDDIESSVVATEAIVRQNIRDINVLKRKAQ